MDWKKELKERVGVIAEGYAADLNNVDGREILTEEHLLWLMEISATLDVAVSDSTI